MRRVSAASLVIFSSSSSALRSNSASTLAGSLPLLEVVLEELPPPLLPPPPFFPLPSLLVVTEVSTVALASTGISILGSFLSRLSQASFVLATVSFTIFLRALPEAERNFSQPAENVSQFSVKAPLIMLPSPTISSTINPSTFLTTDHRILNVFPIDATIPRTNRDSLYNSMNQLQTSTIPLMIAVIPLLTNVLACVIIDSNVPPVRSNKPAMALSSSTWLCNCSSCRRPSSPDFSLTSSMLTLISLSVVRYL